MDQSVQSYPTAAIQSSQRAATSRVSFKSNYPPVESTPVPCPGKLKVDDWRIPSNTDHFLMEPVGGVQSVKPVSVQKVKNVGKKGGIEFYVPPHMRSASVDSPQCTDRNSPKQENTPTLHLLHGASSTCPKLDSLAATPSSSYEEMRYHVLQSSAKSLFRTLPGNCNFSCNQSYSPPRSKGVLDWAESRGGSGDGIEQACPIRCNALSSGGIDKDTSVARTGDTKVMRSGDVEESSVSTKYFKQILLLLMSIQYIKR